MANPITFYVKFFLINRSFLVVLFMMGFLWLCLLNVVRHTTANIDLIKVTGNYYLRVSLCHLISLFLCLLCFYNVSWYYIMMNKDNENAVLNFHSGLLLSP